MPALPDENKLLRNFARCQDGEERYLYMIELGGRLPALEEAQRNDNNLISGCQSQVWIDMQKQGDGTILFAGDSDAVIVKGLVAIVIILFQGKTAQQILALDVKSFFQQLALEQHLTPSRTQGLNAMIRTILARANELV
ncbi:MULTISPECIES: cysteine desulfuration protein SufE [Providencia]|uniref:SufE family iron-sulfur cluster assembly sulfur acceptor protein n=1 Tax=Providencia heimbachae ATCC 35613 TaxID=1354272 RepID=A0A1B7K219_9GAMM|nr:MULTISPECIES: cysteine desulfuration protein SufE [Providencia]MBP6121122.1 cysteine desulfuration protein SufE [Providencia sp.]MDD9341198.1 cysteine desulfuration protein SufE [Providencia heimbachae]NIH22985.1 cysteine desulfuration protein SufE [Providencia heimbachae]OAT54192.1 SufE family iron-sulfur cluster assembly sulfur acceptor protein [Providencia heimbachae ATCC 35613]QCJ70421.1 cysteine desulfuration protein SufE [Providencia heimbachae]